MAASACRPNCSKNIILHASVAENPGAGTENNALIWSAYQVSDVDGVEKLAREGKIRELPRMGEKARKKTPESNRDYRRISGRFLIDAAETEANNSRLSR